MLEGVRHFGQLQVLSPLGVEDPKPPGLVSPMYVHGEGPPVPPMGSGYQSDPTPSAFLPRVPSMITRPNYKAQPAHTNLNIAPKHVITMPPDTIKRNGNFPGMPIGLAPPIPRSDGQTMTTSIMTATNSSSNSGFAFGPMEPGKHLLNWMPVPPVPGYPIRSPSMNGNPRGFACSVTNTTSITMATHSVTCGAIHPGHPGNGLKNSNSHGQLSGDGTGHETVHSVAPLVQNSCPSPAATSGGTAPHMMHAATSQPSTTCSSGTCSSCGGPCGHLDPATYPYHTSIPHPLAHTPFWHMSPHFPSTSNGLVPQMFRHPGGISYQIPPSNNFPNGLSPELLSLNNYPFLPHSVPSPFMTPRGTSGYYPYHTLVRQPSREEKTRKHTCHNCGSPDHYAAECREKSMEHFLGECM